MDRNQKTLIFEGAASSAYLILTQGALYTAIALFFGLDTWWLGVTASFPLAFQLMQLFAPSMVARSRNRPRLLNTLNALRGVWLIPVAGSLFGYRVPALFIVCFAISQGANALAANTWICMVRDLVPTAERGRYFGTRNIAVGIVTIAAMPVYTLLLDHVPEPWNVASVVCLGMISTVFAILSMRFVSDKPLAAPSISEGSIGTDRAFSSMIKALQPANLVRDNLERLGDLDFQRLVVAFFAWNFVIQIASPYFALHMIRDLRLSMTAMGAIATSVSILSLITFRAWGRLADRLGHKSVLIFGLLVVSLIPLMWVFMGPPIWPALVAADIALTVIGWSAVNLTLLTLPLETSPRADSGYFALLNALGGLGGLLGSIFGGSLAVAFGDFNARLFGVDIGGLQLLFGINAILRLGVVLLFLRVRTHSYVRPATLVMNVLSLLARRNPLRQTERNGD